MRLESDGGRARGVAGRGGGGRGVLLELGRGGLVDEFWVKPGKQQVGGHPGNGLQRHRDHCTLSEN